MRKINLQPYDFSDGEPYDVKGSIVSLLFSGHLNLGYRQLLEHEHIAQKIEASNSLVLLEETEYREVLNAVETFTGYGRPDVEFISRITEAPEVEVKEA